MPTPPRHHHSRGLGMTAASVRAKLLEELRQQGITDERVLEAMARIPRHEFVEEALKSDAYRNRALPIGHAQTISQPYVVALMTQALLGGGKRKKVLEVGTGSGYQTAVLAELVEIVFTVERIRPLTEVARQRLQAMGYRNVHFGYADGSLGWTPYAPFDGILVTAGAESVPAALTDQLAPGGRLVIPVGPRGGQSLLLIERGVRGLTRKDLGSVTFVPLLTGKV
jgi:protein-L-isoaspartate(D-aspartate) O-methyltransferase